VFYARAAAKAVVLDADLNTRIKKVSYESPSQQKTVKILIEGAEKVNRSGQAPVQSRLH